MTEDVIGPLINESPGLALCGCGASSRALMRFPYGYEYLGITGGYVTEDVRGPLRYESPGLVLCGSGCACSGAVMRFPGITGECVTEDVTGTLN